MDRVHYRRVKPSSGNGNTRNYHTQQSESVTPGDTLIMQCIISGILLVVVLLIGLVDATPTVTLRDGLREVMTGANTIDELTTDIRHFGETWLGWETQTSSPVVDIPIIPLPEPTMLEIPLLTEYPPSIPPLTAYDEVLSNPQIPGPSVVPGLWD